MRVALLFAALASASILCGALGQPALAGEIPFRAIEREHFNALAVATERGEPSAAPLEVRLSVLGDAADVDLSEAWEWLASHANVRVVPDPQGAPLYLTRHDLTATSGRATLGATVPEGIAIEARDERIAQCVAAHETLHLLGLRHVADRQNIMYEHCKAGFLATATLDEDQRERLDAIQEVRATMPTGVRTWASR